MTDNNFVISGPEPLGPIPEGSLGKLLFERLLNSPASAAMVDGYTARTYSYQAILRRSCELAEALRSHGCPPGTRVLICSENNVEFFIPVLACLFLGAIVVPINPSYKAYEIYHFSTSLCQPSIIFCSKGVSKNFVDPSNTLKLVIVIDFPGDGILNISGAVSLSIFIILHLAFEEVDLSKFMPFNDCNPAEHVAAILCSSGISGLPKGVMITHRNIIVRFAQSRDPKLQSPDGIVLGLMPFCHVYGFNLGLVSIYNYDQIVVLKKFEEDVFLKTIEDYKITSLALVPSLVVFMAKTPKLAGYNLKCIKEIYCGDAPLSKEFEDILKKRLNIPMIRQVYGLTESCHAVTVRMPEDAHKSGSCGRVITYMQLKVISTETGESLGHRQPGEICIKGPTVMKGYYMDENSTAEIFTSDGWLKTGDLGYYDEDKYFYIVDRLKELIKYNSYQVAPAELEEILCRYPSVLDAGVIGVPHESAGELPMALIVKMDEFEVTQEELQGYVASMVSSQKRLRGGVIFVPNIPRNRETGNILRTQLKYMVEAYERDRETKP